MNAAAPLAWSRRLAWAAVVFLGANVLLAVFDASRFLAEIDLAERAEHGLASAAEWGQFQRDLELVRRWGLWLVIGTAILWLIWEHLAFRNVERIGVRGLSSGPWGAVGWWFVPIANFFMPFRGVRDLWKASGQPLSTGWSVIPSWSVIGWWWATLLGSRVVASLGLSLRREAESAFTLARADRVVIASDLILAAAGVLAILVVRGIARRQGAGSVVVEVPPRPDP